MCDMEAISVSLAAFTELRVHGHNKARLDVVERSLADQPEIVEYWRTCGEADFILKTITPDLNAYHRVVTEGLLKIEGVSLLRSISHVRLKRSGAWWLEANGNAMLRIRCALYNGTFEQIFADYTTAHQGAKSSP
jgi:hypothetical protein